MRTGKLELASTAVRTEGALLPRDLLLRLVASDSGVGGLHPKDYGLSEGEKVTESISRAWNRLLGTYASFRKRLEALPEGEPATTETRDRWLLILFQELGYGRVPLSKGLEIEGKGYPISHLWGRSPIHLVGWNIEIDKSTKGVAGASRMSPHSLVQEFLNRSDDHLWGFVSNGRRLRLLRDNVSLSRQAYVEFDLETIMDGELYSDFALVWLVCHASRVDALPPESCWLEQWCKYAKESGVRAMDHLREGVENAINALGGGFLSHDRNRSLKDKLRSGELKAQDYYRQLLRLVYRLLFLLVVEDRGLLHAPEAQAEAMQRYARFYSLNRLRKFSARHRGTDHTDMWQCLRLIMDKLGQNQGCPELGLPPLGSFLWSNEAISELVDSEISNRDLLDCIRCLCLISDKGIRRIVDYRNLGTEELGGIYESLLELHPIVNVDAGTFHLHTAGGHERKTTGSYYTPTVLILSLLDTALEPVLERATREKDPERAILNLKVCDASCGSGHFLVAAAHRIAKRLASVRSKDTEPSPESTRKALRDVIGHCIYGVDINPMAVELCKVSLWMEALDPGKPLSFLDHHVQCGNSLVGTTPALMERGIPDSAFDAVADDDKELCKQLKKQNRDARRSGQTSLLDASGKPWDMSGALASDMWSFAGLSDDTVEAVHRKEDSYRALLRSSAFSAERLAADAWCAAFLWRKVKTEDLSYPVTDEMFRRIQRDPESCPEWMKREIERLAVEYQVFHWHLAFPEVFSSSEEHGTPNAVTGCAGGFDVVLGNPPWDVHEIRDSEFFAVRYPEAAATKTAKERKGLLQKIAKDDPDLWSQYTERVAHMERERLFLGSSGRFSLSAAGSINLFKLLVENDHDVLNGWGHVGLVIPSSFISDSSSRTHFQTLHSENRIASVYDLENYEDYFSGTDRRFKFCLITILGRGDEKHAKTDFVFWARNLSELKEPDRHLKLSHQDLYRLNPLSGSAPVVRSSKDLELAIRIQERGVLLDDSGADKNSGWLIRQRTMLPTEDASSPQQTCEHLQQVADLEGNTFRKNNSVYLPVYEGKMVGMFDHRTSSLIFNPANRVRKIQAEDLTEADHKDAHHLSMPMFWVDAGRLSEKLGRVPRWALGVKEITYVTNERTVIGSILPSSGLANTLIWLDNPQTAVLNACLMGNLNSFVLDYVARQKVAGLHLRGHYIAQLPILPLDTYAQPVPFGPPHSSLGDWIMPRVLELVYTAWDLEPFAADCGIEHGPFRWDTDRRHLLRCEIDAAYFHLYGVARQEIDYILETFPTVKRKDGQAYGEYRTKRHILEVYDAMQRAMDTRETYKTLLDPPPGSPCDAHGRFVPMSKWNLMNWPPHIHRTEATI